MANSLTVSPTDHVVFKGPYNVRTHANLNVTNLNSEQPVAFKVKCTDNEKFAIRPVTGILAPGQSQTVAVTRHAFDFNPTNVAQDCIGVFHIITEATTAEEAFQGARGHMIQLDVKYDPDQRPVGSKTNICEDPNRT